MTHLEEEILAMVRTTVMNHDKVWLHYSSLVTQLNESRHRVLPCTQIKGQNKMRWDVGMNEAREKLRTWSLSVIMNLDGAKCLKGNFPDFQPGLYHHNVGPNELFGGHLAINEWGALGEFNTDNVYNNYPLAAHYPTYYMATYKKKIYKFDSCDFIDSKLVYCFCYQK